MGKRRPYLVPIAIALAALLPTAEAKQLSGTPEKSVTQPSTGASDPFGFVLQPSQETMLVAKKGHSSHKSHSSHRSHRSHVSSR